MSNIEEKQMQQAEQRADAAFGRFLDAPTTKFMLSMIPPTDKAPPETLETLLQQAFAAGRGCGSSEVLGTMLEVMMKPKEQQK